MILCYEVGREVVTGLEHLRIPDLQRIIQLNETMASIFDPCHVIGVAMNGRRVTAEQAKQEQERVSG